jgi:hypothetical protein
MDKIFTTIKERILFYIENQGINKASFFKKIDVSASNFKGVGLKSEIGGDKIVKILSKYSDLNPEWLLTGKGEMLRNINQNVHNSPNAHTENNVTEHKDTKKNNIKNNKGIIVSEVNNTGNIDNRQYYSDSPDVLRAQIAEKDLLLREKDERLREKDDYIAELKATIRELREAGHKTA